MSGTVKIGSDHRFYSKSSRRPIILSFLKKNEGNSLSDAKMASILVKKLSKPAKSSDLASSKVLSMISRVPVSSGGVRPHCAVRIRALHGPEIAGSKMGYDHADCSSGQPAGPRMTSDRFHPLRKSLLSPDNKNFCTSHFSNCS